MDDSYIPRNRIKQREPRGKAGYCLCDRAMVSPGQKCRVCGQQCGKDREKKSTLDPREKNENRRY